MNSTLIRLGISVTGALLLLTAQVSGQETLAGARELYHAAAYEDALRVLDRVEQGSQPAERPVIHQYRAFCLVALGRTADAERAIETVVAVNPFYHPSGVDVSPRLRAAFTSVRQRMLPAIIQQTYAHAKQAFDQKDFAAAAAGFDQVLQALADPDLAGESKRSPLSDLGTLAVGFRELSVRASAPVTAAVPPREVREVPVGDPKPVVARTAPRIYASGGPNITLPVPVVQELPKFPRNIGTMKSGVLEVIIGENGRVEEATIRSSINPRYDALAVEAARTWRYKPATVNGKPVKFRKTIAVNVKPGA